MKIKQASATAKIVTVTANTATDYIINVDKLFPGDNVVADSSIEFASGKGINVAKTIASLGSPVTVLGFVGRQSHGFFNEINSELITADFTVVEGKTRTNITLAETDNGAETHVRTSGFKITVPDITKLIENLSVHLVAGDIVVFSGSLPDGAGDHVYRMMIDHCRSKSVRVYLDSSGESLAKGLQARPDLIKPNLQEFEELTGRKFSDEQAIVDLAREFIHQGTGTIIVSRAEEGAIFIDSKIALAASVDCKEFDVPVTSIGCGDALLGGFAWAQLQGQGLRVAIKTAVSCGVANLFSAEPGRFDKKQFLQIKERVLIRSIYR